jgi:hypothetical protein
MALFKRIGLQFFAEGGGDGGASAGSGESSAGTVSSESTQKTEYPKGIPERAKKYYDMAVAKTQKVDTVAKDNAVKTENTPTEEEGTAKQPPEASPAQTQKLSYKELIKSDEYKADHERHMQKAIKDRMKSTDELLGLIAQKYGLDTASETFKDDLRNALKADDSVYERYAEEHDVSIEEAKRMVGIENQLKQATQAAEERRSEDEYNRTINALRSAGEQTKAIYTDFDLDTAMMDDRFRRLVVAFGGDTTQAYEAINHKALQQKAVAEAESRAQAAVQNSVKANRSRPPEGGLSSINANDVAPDFKSMKLEQLREYAERNRIKR